MATRILVVDDSPTIRTVVSTILERRGYDPKVAHDGQDALEALASGEVEADLVLVDFVMPRMNGYQFCRALRENPKLQATPVVLMSAKGDRIRDQFVTQTGALDAITKPFDAQALVLVIENALRKINTSRASSARLSQVDLQDDLQDDSELDLAEVKGESSPSIPAAIPISPGTVEIPADAEAQALHQEPILSGDLGAIAIGAILQLLQAEDQSGVLYCTRGGVEVRAAFRSGVIDLVQSTGASDEFRIGRFFVEAGILTPQAIEAFTQGLSPTRKAQRTFAPPDDSDAPPKSNVHPSGSAGRSDFASVVPATIREDTAPVPAHRAHEAEARPVPLGAALLAAKKIDAAQLKAALIRQSSELLYEVIRWQSGRFELRREAPSALAAEARLGMPVASVVMEGFRRVDEWRVLERTLGSFDAVLARDDAAFGALGIGSLPSKERAVLDAVDGERSVRDIVSASHQSSFDVCRILVQFLEARVLRRHG